MVEVVLHIYDVQNHKNVRRINRFFKDGIGLGGIFHGAIEIYGGVEWSYGYSEKGTGVSSYPSGKNPWHTYREKIVLGSTNCTEIMIRNILNELKKEWLGKAYRVLSKNCNHFCDALCERLGVRRLPGWVNRFANAGKTTFEVADNIAIRIKKAKSEVASASKVAYRFLSGCNGPPKLCKVPRNSDNGSLRMKESWLKGTLNQREQRRDSEVI